jgi:ATP-dependent Lon protease
MVEQVEDPGMLADLILAHYRIEVSTAQGLLEELNPLKRIRAVNEIIKNDLEQFVVSENIKDIARDEMSKGQREYFLREQLRAIQRELGEQETSSDDLEQLKSALSKIKLPDQARNEVQKQLSRLEKMHPEASEYALLRTYLEWIVDLPWNVYTDDVLDIQKARKVLDAEHFGLGKVKDRILEFLSVRKLNPDSKGSILCFVGPPGVGKTSLGRSIARAMGRKFFRMSLGGIRDEAEIRGHRRTYVGALPGRIIQGLKQAGSSNPVFVLDELDKIGADFRGDPSSALLEVLDPAQNNEFRDHYLNVDYDLSRTLFIATANTTDTIPEALLDRLEVVYISGYTTEEKLSILERFLVPRQLKENGLSGLKLSFPQSAMRFLIERYTRESGVRNLEREFGSLCRKIAREKAEKKRPHTILSEKQIQKFLGPTKFDPESNEQRSVVGLARGLAWTIHGGELLPLEVSIAKGKGNTILTGQLGSVMQESAQTAVFFIRSHAEKLGVDPLFYEKNDIHVHAPAAATPKDGPSAGITIASALLSALTGRKIRADVAMTGEMTLRGAVLPVGGIKEKCLAALRYGIKTVLIPFENAKDIEDIPEAQRKRLNFVLVKNISEVFDRALEGVDQARVLKPNRTIGKRP